MVKIEYPVLLRQLPGSPNAHNLRLPELLIDLHRFTTFLLELLTILPQFALHLLTLALRQVLVRIVRTARSARLNSLSVKVTVSEEVSIDNQISTLMKR